MDTRCERFQVARVVGEDTVQVVERAVQPVPPCAQLAKKIVSVTIEVIDVVDHVFIDKVVEEGRFHVQLLYVGCDDIVRHTCFEKPYSATAEIRGARPGVQAQHQVVRVEQDATLLTQLRPEAAGCQAFEVHIVAHLLIRVVECVEEDLVKCPERTWHYAYRKSPCDC